MSANDKRAPVLVVGGGIGGLGAALVLSRKGIAVHVIEQASEFKEIGAGIQLGPNVFWMFEYLGLTEEMSRLAVFPLGLEMRDAITGQTFAELPVDDRFYEKYHVLRYLAQGANMALEDAVCLAEQAAAHGPDYATAFKAYQEIRYLRTARVQLMARVFGEVYHASGINRELRNQVIGEWTAQGGVDMSWLYGHQLGLPRVEAVAVPKQTVPL